METCANCHRTIGDLEPVQLFKQNVVCIECDSRLRASTSPPPTPAPVAPATSRRPLRSGEMICPNPNCGYVGMPRRESKGSNAVLVILLLLWILPGIIYLIVYYGYVLKCPRCGMKMGEANS